MMVSICMITYGHERYILQAITSILNQKCNFEFEIILSNDCSPDNTDSIVFDFIKEENLSNKIKYFSHKQNLGITPNFVFALQKCKAKYIAICEGDDYWTDPLKLQKQVDFLEQNNNFSGVATNSLVKYEGSTKEHLFRKKLKSNLQTNDLLESRHFHTATFLFRKTAFRNDFPKQVLSADRTLFLLVSCFGSIKLLDDVTAVYRKNDGGISRQVTSEQMILDYNIAKYIKTYNTDFNIYRLKSFISKTVVDYSHKIYLIDFLRASSYLVYYNFMMKNGFRNKLSSIKSSFKFLLKKMNKVRF
ncbi:glycosyltransferase [Winogradskyella sediminis]|nr:glycosyltransferase [Winogradskyella sediminis]